MKSNKKIIRFSNLFSATNVDGYLHAFCGYGKNELPFKTHNSNQIWNRDKSIKNLLRPGAEASWKHDYCALDTTREATTKEIILGLGGVEILSSHLYAYHNIEQLVSNCPSYRRCFGDDWKIKEEMNLFFTLGKDGKLCAVGVYFGPYPLHQYSVFALEAMPPQRIEPRRNFFQRLFSLKKTIVKEKKWPSGTRVFFIGDSSEVFESSDCVQLSVA